MHHFFECSLDRGKDVKTNKSESLFPYPTIDALDEHGDVLGTLRDTEGTLMLHPISGVPRPCKMVSPDMVPSEPANAKILASLQGWVRTFSVDSRILHGIDVPDYSIPGLRRRVNVTLKS